jgi:hypothetical protein
MEKSNIEFARNPCVAFRCRIEVRMGVTVKVCRESAELEGARTT